MVRKKQFFFCKPKGDMKTFEGQCSCMAGGPSKAQDGQACPRAVLSQSLCPSEQVKASWALNVECFRVSGYVARSSCSSSSGPLYDPGESYGFSPEDATQTYI